MASQAWPDGAPRRPARPMRIERPRDVEGVADAVRAAVRDGLTVRPTGAGSTPVGLTTTDGVLLDLTGLDRLRSVDPTAGTAVVEAGIRLSRLWPLLWEHGLGVDAPGGLDHQTLGGAVSTGEHGSGLRYGGLSSRVQALEMVLADGTVTSCSPQQESDLFQAARVGLGAFGVVTAVTLACDPAVEVELSVAELARSSFLDQVDELVERHDHVEFGWRPEAEQVLCTTAERVAVAAGRAGRPGPGRSGLTRVGHVLGLPSVRMLADRGYRVFGRRTRTAGREIEFAVPRACFPAVFDELRERIEALQSAAVGALRVRFGAAEDAWLAMGQGRETAYVCATARDVRASEPFFGVLEAVATRYDGRPHWGRPHRLHADSLRRRYPRFDDARAVRDRVDPARVFGNLHLGRLLGA
jgi:L-gulono-1,4-lactone dehydrogenase